MPENLILVPFNLIVSPSIISRLFVYELVLGFDLAL
jgi:hypothetical protein